MTNSNITAIRVVWKAPYGNTGYVYYHSGCYDARASFWRDPKISEVLVSQIAKQAVCFRCGARLAELPAKSSEKQQRAARRHRAARNTESNG